jgi:hypothetical protein
MAECAEDILRDAPGPAGVGHRLADALRRFDAALASCRATQAAASARELMQHLEQLRARTSPDALDPLGRIAESLCAHFAPWRASSEKPLEIAWAMIRFHLERGSCSSAILLLREWMLERVAGASARGGMPLARAEALRRLERLAAGREGHEGGTHADLSALWRALGEIYEKVLRCGLNAAEPDDLHGRACEIAGWVEARRHEDRFWQLPEPAGPVVLLAALGTTAGALYTALCRLPAVQELRIITSAEGERLLAEILRRSGRTDLGSHLEVYRVEDPFLGAHEWERVPWKEDLLRAGRLMRLLTGGTATLQWIVERLSWMARAAGVPVESWIAADRRPRAEQEREPWVPGEIVQVPSALDEVSP